jgi:U3 small nucleolar ribonucleoprotein protein IMP3
MRQYHVQDRDDYKKYNKIVGMITKLTSVLKHLDAKDSTRIELTEQLLNKWAAAAGRAARRSAAAPLAVLRARRRGTPPSTPD